MLSRRSIRGRKTWLILASVMILQLTHGVFQKLFLEEDFRLFMESYPATLDNFPETVKRYMSSPDTDPFQPPPINLKHTRIKFLEKLNITKAHSLGLLVVVKSACQNRKKRNTIRKTWGNARYLRKTFISSELPTEVVFIIGLPREGMSTIENVLFHDELNYGDIIQADFLDTYRNNTHKTLLSLRYAIEEVRNFKYLMIVDDDMYVDLVNVIAFIHTIPSTTVQVLSSKESGVKAQYLGRYFDFGDGTEDEWVSLKDEPIIVGDLRVDYTPNRNLIGPNSQWTISIKEYPFDYFPPFVAGGATLFDKSAVTLIYYGSIFTQPLWIDDVYIGLIAYKMGIKLTKTERISCAHDSISDTVSPTKLSTMMAIHGLQCPEQLVELWNSRNPQELSECIY